MSAYSDAVLADSPLYYWPMGDSSSPLAEVDGGPGIAITGAALDQPGPLAVGDEGAASFDGADDFGQVPVDLSGTSVVTLEWWMSWDAFANNDDLAFEFTANFNNVAGGFIVNPNAGTGEFEVGMSDGLETGYNLSSFERPSAGAWHHFALVMDRTAAPAEQIVPYVDGEPVAYDKPLSADINGAFANSLLNLMCRNGASLFGGGDQAHLALYVAALSPERIAAHYAAALAPPEQGEGSAELAMALAFAATGHKRALGSAALGMRLRLRATGPVAPGGGGVLPWADDLPLIGGRLVGA